MALVTERGGIGGLRAVVYRAACLHPHPCPCRPRKDMTNLASHVSSNRTTVSRLSLHDNLRTRHPSASTYSVPFAVASSLETTPSVMKLGTTVLSAFSCAAGCLVCAGCRAAACDALIDGVSRANAASGPAPRSSFTARPCDVFIICKMPGPPAAPACHDHWASL
ncbi:hypothetical protein PtA15_18A232 [Puccinia triticina]|uniref:Uncharacterized protein n=1 Tax=Puccinia triticina TaxID=208348 RepID=A0ABY7D8S4_9BASI|nr:uncharacterized protein PtA15_18A232 [Puccinia triticina]WAQ93174.1 hypothetical protein PtA15_18A232 [Puccinia triticina]